MTQDLSLLVHIIMFLLFMAVGEFAIGFYLACRLDRECSKRWHWQTRAESDNSRLCRMGAALDRISQCGRIEDAREIARKALEEK